MQITRLLPDAVGTTCGQRLEKVFGTEHSHILRVPFRTEKGIVRQWISRFEVWPYLETYTEVNFLPHHNFNSGYAFCCVFTSLIDCLLLTGCCSWACQRVAGQARSDRWKLQWWKHCCLFVGT